MVRTTHYLLPVTMHDHFLLALGSDLFLDPYTYSYTNTSYSHNGGPPIKNTTYSTDIVRDIGLGFLDAAIKSDQPFFIGCAYTTVPIACLKLTLPISRYMLYQWLQLALSEFCSSKAP
jgi:hypothetical protein